MRQYLQDGEFSIFGEQSKLLHKHNLHGQNIVIGVADTGIDVKNTFFYDPKHSVVYSDTKQSSSHRKIDLYIPLANNIENDTGGHGTHVCGTIAGKANNENYKEFNVTEYVNLTCRVLHRKLICSL